MPAQPSLEQSILASWLHDDFLVGTPGAAAPSWHATVRARMRSPHPEQARFIQSPAKRKVIRAGRRGGKTVGAATLAVEQFLCGRRILYAVPTQEQVERFWFEVKRALAPAIDARHLYKNETRHLIELPRAEQAIRAKTAWNSDTLRGDYADLLILDEHQLMHESAWGEVGAPMLLDNDGDAVFIYTPPSLRTAARSQAKDARHAAKMFATALADTTGRWAAFHFPSHANPHISESGLEEITSDMTQLAYEQEILAEDKDEATGALWSRAILERTRVAPAQCPDFVRIGIALDPAATSQATSDEMGIVAGARGANGHGYTLKDASMRGTPTACARTAIFLYDELEADVIVAEVNNGGEWIGTVLQLVAEDMYRTGERATRMLNYSMVHASRGKQTRAEPVAVLFERGRAHHVGGFSQLEDQMTNWLPGMKSPDRMDALVWLLTELILNNPGALSIRRL
jgi:hypothetical protein